MFEKQKAKIIYNQLLNELKEMKQQAKNCDNCDRGTTVVNIKPNKKIDNYLKNMAEKDGYSLSNQTYYDKTYTTIYTIEDNKSILLKSSLPRREKNDCKNNESILLKSSLTKHPKDKYKTKTLTRE